MAKVSIITPWLDCPELIATYEKSANTAEVVIVDNGSQPETAVMLRQMVERLGGVYLRNEYNAKYAAANNQGMAAATGDILVFMNNDIDAPPGWVHMVKRDVKDGALYGPSRLERMIGGRMTPYIEGFCIAGTRDTWQRLNGWDSETFTGMYWEDNDVCWRALKMGIDLKQTNWPVWHYGNYTSGNTPGAYDNSQTNYDVFTAKVAADVS